MRAVYTSVVGDSDGLRSDQTMEHCDGEEEWIAFSDRADNVPPWQTQPCFNGFRHPNPNAKCPKILAHQWLPRAEFSLWMDANLALKVPLTTLIRMYLDDADVAMFAHNARDCVYEEQIASEKTHYSGLPMRQQVDRYRAEGWPERGGLMQGGFILRRHTPEAERFNNYWWSEVCRWGWQDQLSLPIAASKAKVAIKTIPGDIVKSDIVDFRPHASRGMGSIFYDLGNAQ